MARYEALNPKKRWAKTQVSLRLKTGALTRGPCEVCGALKAQGHHDDYNKPLEVRWLCHVHHRAWHAKHGEGRNPSGPAPEEALACARLRPKTSRYVGVCRHSKGHWEAQLQVGGKTVFRGNFKTEIGAARAYDEAAVRFRGAKARLNFPKQTEAA